MGPQIKNTFVESRVPTSGGGRGTGEGGGGRGSEGRRGRREREGEEAVDRIEQGLGFRFEVFDVSGFGVQFQRGVRRASL